jgi:hypothetical protein
MASQAKKKATYTLHKPLLCLTFPEQHIGIPREAKPAQLVLARDSLALLKLDVICYNDVGEQRLHFDGRQVPPRAVNRE